MVHSDIMRINIGSKHDGHVNMNAEHGLGHEHDGQTHVQAPEEMHHQAARRLSFDSWLPHNIGIEGSSSSNIEQMDHVLEPYIRRMSRINQRWIQYSKENSTCSYNGELFVLVW
jgi:hypothetical protein